MKLTLLGRLWDHLFKGHRSFGWLTVFAFDTAMHGAFNVHTRWGYLCIAVPWFGLGWRTEWPTYAYLSPNATPWAATWLIGKGAELTREDRRMVRVRRALWGHGYDCTRLDPQILDRAVWAAESRTPSAVRSLGRIVDERADRVAA